MNLFKYSQTLWIHSWMYMYNTGVTGWVTGGGDRGTVHSTFGETLQKVVEKYPNFLLLIPYSRAMSYGIFTEMVQQC